jgi:hypothetical protein
MIRNKFKSGFENDYTNFEAEMKKHKVTLMTINTVDDVTTQIKQVLPQINA